MVCVMRRVRSTSLVLAAAVLALALHAHAVAAEELRYRTQPPLILDAGAVAFENTYVPPLAPPNVEHQFAVSPSDAVDRWSAERLVANGGRNRVWVIVEEASVVEVPLEVDQGIAGWFKTEQAERYDAVLKVTVRVSEPDGSNASVTGTITRSVTVPEDISLSDRQQVWADLTNKLVDDLNSELETAMRAHLARYLL